MTDTIPDILFRIGMGVDLGPAVFSAVDNQATGLRLARESYLDYARFIGVTEGHALATFRRAVTGQPGRDLGGHYREAIRQLDDSEERQYFAEAKQLGVPRLYAEAILAMAEVNATSLASAPYSLAHDLLQLAHVYQDEADPTPAVTEAQKEETRRQVADAYGIPPALSRASAIRSPIPDRQRRQRRRRLQREQRRRNR